MKKILLSSLILLSTAAAQAQKAVGAALQLPPAAESQVIRTDVFKNIPVQTVDAVDLTRYLGTWYEIASIPQSFQKQCTGGVSAEYSMADDNLISVVNGCDTASGKRSVSVGRAKVVDKESNAKLKVTFVKFIGWIFAFGGDYWILDLDSNYRYAVVGEGSRKYAWILSRNTSLPQADLIEIEKNLKAQGYDTCKLLTTVQKNGFGKRTPLCHAIKG